jgi:hypothetical protein
MALEQGVNCYVFYEEAEDYFETRIDSGSWHNADEEDRESALVTATMIIDENQFIGVAVSSEQSLSWPRTNATYLEPKLGAYISLSSDNIPDRIKKATFETAYQLLSNENLLEQKTQTFEKISIGSITIEDSNNDVTRTSIVPTLARKFLKPLLINGGAGRTWWRAN